MVTANGPSTVGALARRVTAHQAARPQRPPKQARAGRWMRHMDVPAVPGVRFHLGGHNYGGTLGETSSYDPQGNRVMWQGPLASQQDRSDLYHEMGHAFDYRFANDADRARLRRLIAPKNTQPWRWGKRDPARPGRQPFEETFADVYAQLAMSKGGWPKLRAALAEIASRGHA